MNTRYFLSAQDKSFEDTRLLEIKKAHERIDVRWLLLHYKTTVGLVLFAFIVEFFMGNILINSDMMTTTKGMFVIKFMLVPSIINLFLIAIDYIIIKAEKLSNKTKIYSVSLIFVAICFVLFTAHITFSAMYYVFIVAIMMTTIYTDYQLTSVTAMASAISIFVSEVFIVWDLDKVSIFESTHRFSNFCISLFFLVAFFIACMVAIHFEKEKNTASVEFEVERNHLKKLILLDELTGIANRKALHEALRNLEEEKLFERYILAIVDIDKFKDINDNLGHHVGDNCIVEFAKILKEYNHLFSVFRYGGDEFCILFQDFDIEETKNICKQIQERLEQLQFDEYPLLKITASFGLAVYKESMDSVRLFIQADYALYEAKKFRNSVCVFDSTEKTLNERKEA